MSGILPDLTSGAKTVRDANGACLAPSGVSYAYCPPSTFKSTCDIAALPSDCTARITPAQINAIVSELLCLAVAMSPSGTWNCTTVCNLSSAFTAWASNTGHADGETIVGDGSTADPYTVSPTGLAAAVCADPIAAAAFADCLSPLLDPTDIVAAICNNDAAGDALAACLTSTDAGNDITRGTDGRLFFNGVKFTDSVVPPANPDTSDFWNNTATGKLYYWGGTSWKLVSSQNYTESATAPANPNNGDEWLNTNTGRLYKRENGAWVAYFTPAPVITGRGTSSVTVNADTSYTHQPVSPAVTSDVIINNGFATIQTAGTYLVTYGTGGTQQSGAANVDAWEGVGVEVNGAVVTPLCISSFISDNGSYASTQSSFFMYLNVGDVVWLVFSFYVNGGGTATSVQSSCFMQLQRTSN